MPVDKDAAAQAAGEEKLLSEADTEESEDVQDDVGEDGDEGSEEGEEGGEPGAEDGGEDKEADDGGKPSKSKLKRERIKQRISTLEEIARHESQRADAAAAQLKALSADADPEPKESDYEGRPNDYIADRAAWRADVTAIARQKKTAQIVGDETQKALGNSKQNLFHERAMALVERYPDIEAKVFNDPSAPINQTMAEVLMDSERGPEVAYYLSTHREEGQRIQKMSPLSAAREIGRIEAQLAAPKPKTQTTAPKPVPKVGGGSMKAARDPDKLSDDEWLEHRNRELGIVPGRKKAK